VSRELNVEMRPAATSRRSEGSAGSAAAKSRRGRVMVFAETADESREGDIERPCETSKDV
jgi:hypothetical protein